MYVVYIILNTRCTNDIYKCFSLSELIAQLPLSGGTKRRRVASPRFPMDLCGLSVRRGSAEVFAIPLSLSLAYYLSCALTIDKFSSNKKKKENKFSLDFARLVWVYICICMYLSAQSTPSLLFLSASSFSCCHIVVSACLFTHKLYRCFGLATSLLPCRCRCPSPSLCWQFACSLSSSPPPHSPPPTHLFYRPPQHVVSLLRQLSRIKATWQISSLICLLLLFSVYSFVLFYLALFVFPLLFSVVLLSATHRLAPWHIVCARSETGLLPLTMTTMIVDSR